MPQKDDLTRAAQLLRLLADEIADDALADRLEAYAKDDPRVHVVTVFDREDGAYLFDKLADAERFFNAVENTNGVAWLHEEVIADSDDTDRLVEQELS